MRNSSSSILTHPFPQVLYYAAVFFIPFYRWRHLSEEYAFLSVDWMLVMLLLILLIPYYLVKKTFPKELRSNLGLLYLLFLAINLMSLCLTEYPTAAMDGIRILFMGYIFIALSQMLISQEGFSRTLPLVLGWSVAICSFLAILGYFFDVEMFTKGLVGEGTKRGAGGTIGANNMCIMSVFTLPLLVHWVCYGRNRFSKSITLLLTFVILLGMVSTFSRGGFLHLVLICFLLLLEHRHRFTPKHSGIVITVASLLLLLAVMIIPGSYYERQRTLTKGVQADVSTSRRAAYLTVGWESFKENPVLGTGPYTFKKVWANSLSAHRFWRKERYAHNTYLEVLVGTGILGLFVFLVLLWRVLKNFSQANKYFSNSGNAEMASLVRAYRISYIALLSYFFIHSALDHKMFLLTLALSQVSLTLAHQSTKKDGLEEASWINNLGKERAFAAR
jgi:O-antigen ligase